MDKSSNLGPYNTHTQQKHQNSNRSPRSRPQVERELPFKDLRDLLNHKRQNTDGKNGGPPSDPKYNYLSDPMRDGESSNSTTNNFTPRSTNQRFNVRNPATRGRGRGIFNPETSQQQKPGYSNEPARFPREWDQGKDDARNRRYKNSQYPEGSYKGNDTTFNRQRYHENRPINTNYKGPPHKYIPNYRGGNHQRFPPRRYQHPDPVNISVEYNVEDGFRRCTALDVKLDKTWKKGQNRKMTKQQQPTHDEEENWDDDAAAPGDWIIGGPIGDTATNEQIEAGGAGEAQNVEPGKDDATASPDTEIGEAIGDAAKNEAEDAGDASNIDLATQNKKDEATASPDTEIGEAIGDTAKNEVKDARDAANIDLATQNKKDEATASPDTEIGAIGDAVKNEEIEAGDAAAATKDAKGEPSRVDAPPVKVGAANKRNPKHKQTKRAEQTPQKVEEKQIKDDATPGPNENEVIVEANVDAPKNEVEGVAGN